MCVSGLLILLIVSLSLHQPYITLITRALKNKSQSVAEQFPASPPRLPTDKCPPCFSSGMSYSFLSFHSSLNLKICTSSNVKCFFLEIQTFLPGLFSLLQRCVQNFLWKMFCRGRQWDFPPQVDWKLRFLSSALLPFKNSGSSLQTSAGGLGQAAASTH